MSKTNYRKINAIFFVKNVEQSINKRIIVLLIVGNYLSQFLNNTVNDKVVFE